MSGPSFQDYVTARAKRGVWLREPGLSLYVRGLSMTSPRVDYVIANVEADRPGGGALTRFLDAHEPSFSFRFENVGNERLAAYLARRGYKRVSLIDYDEDLAPCMEKP